MRAIPIIIFFTVSILIIQGCTSDPTVQYVDSGHLVIATVQVDLSDGLTERINVDVPESTESVLIEVSGDGGAYYLTEMVTPSSRDLVEAGVVVTRVARAVPGFVSWQYPAGETGGMEEGTYQFLIRGETPSGEHLNSDDLTLRIYMRKSSTVAQCSIPVDFIVATDAIAETDVDEAIERLAVSIAEFYTPVDITIPQYGVSRVNFPTVTLTVENDTTLENADLSDAANSLGPVLRESLAAGRARPDALHVFVVRSLGTGLNGYAMGLPGPMSGDWPSAGVLVSTTAFASGEMLDPEMMAVSTAHEMGHYLGLYHTSERSQFHDPISDTPECDNEGFCFDDEFARNLMTPGGSPDRYIVTPGQGNVLRRHPLCQ